MPLDSNPLEQSRIFVKDMALDMFIGVYDSEKKAPQRVIVTVTADLSARPHWQSDDIDGTLSYEIIINHIKSIAAEGHIHLVETFAERIAETCLREPMVQRVYVSVEKLDIFDFARVGVEIIREKAS